MSDISNVESTPNPGDRNTIRIVAAIIGVLIGIGNINHGIFKTVQGNIPTSGLVIQAIGEPHRMWIHDSEEALTVVPNYLFTGILAILAGNRSFG